LLILTGNFITFRLTHKVYKAILNPRLEPVVDKQNSRGNYCFITNHEKRTTNFLEVSGSIPLTILVIPSAGSINLDERSKKNEKN